MDDKISHMNLVKNIACTFSAYCFLLLIFSCKKNSVGSGPFPAANGTLVSVALHPENPGFSLPDSFLGLSYEISCLPDSAFINANNTVFINLIKNLGNGYLRIGGNSSDNLVYTGSPRTASTTNDSLASSDIDRLAAFANVIGWKVLFGLNLGNYDPSRASNEAKYASNALGNKLFAFQTGNEPDLFYENGHRASSYTYTDYQNEWDTYFATVRAQVPDAPFAGPDVAYNPSWISSFSTAEHSHVELIDGHYYRTGPATDPSISIYSILSADTKLPAYCSKLRTAASQYQLGYRISECNSVYDGGKEGVSDVFASALWALDYMWIVAANGGQGINFHGGPGGAYTPIAQTNGVFTARPEYYAMLAFKEGCAGNMISLDLSNSANLNCTAYACMANGVEYLTLINKDLVNASFTVSPGKSASSVKVMRLAAPSLIATESITFAGSEVNADGVFQIKTTENYSLKESNFNINVPSGSAAIVIIQ